MVKFKKRPTRDGSFKYAMVLQSQVLKTKHDNVFTFYISCRDLIDSFISEIRQTTDVNSPFYKETGCE